MIDELYVVCSLAFVVCHGAADNQRRCRRPCEWNRETNKTVLLLFNPSMFTKRRGGNNTCRVRTVYSCPLFYGLCLVVLGLLDVQVPAFSVICCVLGGMSILVGLVGHYGVSKQNILALQMSHILVICHSILFFIVTSFLLVELVATKPVVLRHTPPRVIQLLVQNKIVGWTVVAGSYIVIAISFGLAGNITDLMAKLEAEAYADQIGRWKRLKSIERLEKLRHADGPDIERQTLLSSREDDAHQRSPREQNSRSGGGGTGSQEKSDSDSGESHATEVWFSREP